MPNPITPPPTPNCGEVKVGNEVEDTHTPEQNLELQNPELQNPELQSPEWQTHQHVQDLDISPLLHIGPIGTPWKLCYVEMDDIDREGSEWPRIASTTGVYNFGKMLFGYYQILIEESCIPWLKHHMFHFITKAEFECLFGYDPTLPTMVEIDVYGWGWYYVHFLDNAFNAILSKRSPGLEACLRSHVPPNLEAALEWIILCCDISTSPPWVQENLTICLVLLGLSLHEDYNTPAVIQLLEKDQAGVLAAFAKDLVRLYRAASAEDQDQAAELHLTGLVRRLLVFAGGRKNNFQLEFRQERAAIDNLNLLGSLVGSTGSNRFRNFDPQAMLDALHRSNAFSGQVLDNLSIPKLGSLLAIALPIGFSPEFSLLPQGAVPSHQPGQDIYFPAFPSGCEFAGFSTGEGRMYS